MTRANGTSRAPQTSEFARRYIESLVRRGTMDLDVARFQLEAIDAAARSGRPILVVEDVDVSRTERRASRAA